jgi:TetR/AcrR family transcriptional regulator, cholesterol catabolism regulator
MDSLDCTDRIITEAAELFSVYGTKAVTMDSLAQHLGISKRTIYEKFRDKDELLGTVLRCMMQKQKEAMEKMIKSEKNVLVAFFKHGRIMRDYFSSVNPIFKSDLKKFHSEVITKLHNVCGDQFQNTLSFIKIGILQGVLRNDINPDIVNRCIQGMSRMITDPELFPPEQFVKGDVMRDVFINYLRGICTEEGLKTIAEYENYFE